jgi:GNAT superfamily N-acetyltransferase
LDSPIMPASYSIRPATVADLKAVVPLFDAYRQFYRQPSDQDLARRFLLDRLEYNESTILLAEESNRLPVGFTQLFPSFSSLSAAPIFILNDLFVAPAARHQGVASLLLRAAASSPVPPKPFASRCLRKSRMKHYMKGKAGDANRTFMSTSCRSPERSSSAQV